MRTLWTTAVLLLIASSAQAAGITEAVDGACAPDSQEPGISGIGDAVSQAWAATQPNPQAALERLAVEQFEKRGNEAGRLPPCVSKDSPVREVREHAERKRIEEAVQLAAKDQCLKTTCVGNATYLVTGYSHNFFNFFGGCENWSRLTADTIGGGLQYHTIEREQRCNFPGHCHYVVVLRNTRTKDVETVDAWAYAGGWVFGGIRKKDASVFGSYSEFKLKYGLRTDHEAFGKAFCDEGGPK